MNENLRFLDESTIGKKYAVFCIKICANKYASLRFFNERNHKYKVETSKSVLGTSTTNVLPIMAGKFLKLAKLTLEVYVIKFLGP